MLIVLLISKRKEGRKLADHCRVGVYRRDVSSLLVPHSNLLVTHMGIVPRLLVPHLDQTAFSVVTAVCVQLKKKVRKCFSFLCWPNYCCLTYAYVNVLFKSLGFFFSFSFLQSNVESLNVFLLNLSSSHSQLSVSIKGETSLDDTVESCFVELHGMYSLYFSLLKMVVWL